MDIQHQSSSLPSAFLFSDLTPNTNENTGSGVSSSHSSSTRSGPLRNIPINVANQQPKQELLEEYEEYKKQWGILASYLSKYNKGATEEDSGNFPIFITDWKQSYIEQYFVPGLKTVEEKVSPTITEKTPRTTLFGELWDALETRCYFSAAEVFDDLYDIIGIPTDYLSSAKEVGKVRKLLTLEFQQVANMFGLCCPLPQSEFMTKCSECEKMCHHCCVGYNEELLTPLDPICYECKPIMAPSTDDDGCKARDLPTCESTEYMEKKTKELIIEYRRNFASKITSDVHSEEHIPNFFIRLVSSQKKQFSVKVPQLGRTRRSKAKKLEGHYYEKIYLVFLENDGKEMILFAMEVHEYPENNMRCNQKVAYLAYLESVKHDDSTIGYNVFRSIVSSYFSWCKVQGFHRGHIWSSINDTNSYIFFDESPSDGMSQKQLDEWYGKLMVEMFGYGILDSKYIPKKKCSWNMELPHCYGGIFTLNDYATMKEVNALLKQTAQSVFTFYLNPKQKEFNYVTENHPSSFFRSRDYFFDKCKECGWNFATLHQTVHATKAIVECLHEEIRN